MSGFEVVVLIIAAVVFLGIPCFLLHQMLQPVTCKHGVDIGYPCRWCAREWEEESDQG